MKNSYNNNNNNISNNDNNSFAVPEDHRVKMKENEKINKYLNEAWEQRKAVEHDDDNDDDDNNCICCTFKGLQKQGKKTEGIGNQRKNQ